MKLASCALVALVALPSCSGFLPGITDADELFAKLPIGAAGLEGELERSGRLAVQATVAGQLRPDNGPTDAPATLACGAATHFMSAISVGAFRLLSGGNASGNVAADAGFAWSREERFVTQESLTPTKSGPGVGIGLGQVSGRF